MPSARTVRTFSMPAVSPQNASRRTHLRRSTSSFGGRFRRRFGGILHVLDRLELDVLPFAVLLRAAADVHGLDDVARLRVDGERAARTLDGQTLERRHQQVCIELAAGLLCRL